MFLFVRALLFDFLALPANFPVFAGGNPVGLALVRVSLRRLANGSRPICLFNLPAHSP